MRAVAAGAAGICDGSEGSRATEAAAFWPALLLCDADLDGASVVGLSGCKAAPIGQHVSHVGFGFSLAIHPAKHVDGFRDPPLGEHPAQVESRRQMPGSMNRACRNNDSASGNRPSRYSR